MAFEVHDFQTEVIEASRSIPVVVDFWAPWCGPCRVLGPVLERLATEQQDRWKLAKVNTEEQPAVSNEYGIRGIPAVKLFVDGTVRDEFVGALPEPAVRQWIEKALPSVHARRLADAEAALRAGEAAAAAAMLREVVEDDPANGAARVLLAKALAFSEPDAAEALIEGLDVADPVLLQTVDAVRTVARLSRLHATPDDLPDGPGRVPYAAALDALAGDDFDTALQRFIEVVMKDRYYDDDGARKACVALFTLLGPEHPITRRHRRLFDMALY
jgi:putative thioredoxin